MKELHAGVHVSAQTMYVHVKIVFRHFGNASSGNEFITKIEVEDTRKVNETGSKASWSSEKDGK